MPQPTKPGIPWTDIRARYCDGVSATFLEKQYPVSRQAIMRRVKLEGWSRHVSDELTVTAPVSSPATTGQTTTRELSPQDRYGMRTAENETLAVEMASRGATFSMIAGRVGMTVPALKQWRDANPDFETRIQDAMSSFAEARMADITAASERGDARAAQWTLERHSMTRAELGGKEQGGGPTLQIILNVPRGTEPITIEGETIEGEVTEATY